MVLPDCVDEGVPVLLRAGSVVVAAGVACVPVLFDIDEGDGVVVVVVPVPVVPVLLRGAVGLPVDGADAALDESTGLGLVVCATTRPTPAAKRAAARVPIRNRFMSNAP